MQIGPLSSLLWNLFGPTLTAHFYELKILRIYPHAPLKISAILLFFFWLDMKYVCVKVIHMLLPSICQAVLRKVFASQHKRHERTNVFHVFRGELDPSQ